MFTPERGVDGKKYNSNSGIMRCAEIAAELTSEYTKQDSFCLDGSIPDFMDKTLSLPDVFAFECCSDQISVCAATATLKVTLELSSLSPPLAKDEAVLKQDIASLLGVETSEFANFPFLDCGCGGLLSNSKVASAIRMLGVGWVAKQGKEAFLSCRNPPIR